MKTGPLTLLNRLALTRCRMVSKIIIIEYLSLKIHAVFFGVTSSAINTSGKQQRPMKTLFRKLNVIGILFATRGRAIVLDDAVSVTPPRPPCLGARARNTRQRVPDAGHRGSRLIEQYAHTNAGSVASNETLPMLLSWIARLFRIPVNWLQLRLE